VASSKRSRNTSLPGPFDFDVSDRPPLPRLRGVFVTATDTEVGKTLIAGAIARQLRTAGRRVEVLKPVATGCRRDRHGLVSADAEFLAACADSRRTLAEIAPVRYASPAAPNIAARREDRPVDLEEVFRQYARLEGAAEAVIVEGIGGLLCPITDEFWVIHLARMMALPVVIVAGAGLGTINHTLLTLQAARCAGLYVAGVIVNRYRLEPTAPQGTPPPTTVYARGDADLAMSTNPRQIAELGKVKVLAIVPDDPSSSVEKLSVGDDVQFPISQTDWEEILSLPPRA
jgi:dethiobiotin synthetase